MVPHLVSRSFEGLFDIDSKITVTDVVGVFLCSNAPQPAEKDDSSAFHFY